MQSKPLVSVVETWPSARGNVFVAHAAEDEFGPVKKISYARAKNAHLMPQSSLRPGTGVRLRLGDDQETTSIESVSTTDRYVRVQSQGTTVTRYRDELYRPMHHDPVRRAAGRNDGEVHRHRYLDGFADYANSSWDNALARTSADGVTWGPTSAVWKSPDICYQPLYYEQVNLERFGARFPGMQPAISAAHFLFTTYQLPTLMLLDSPFQCRYVAGYGRPGNAYCLHRPRGIHGTLNSFQAILPPVCK